MANICGSGTLFSGSRPCPQNRSEHQLAYQQVNTLQNRSERQLAYQQVNTPQNRSEHQLAYQQVNTPETALNTNLLSSLETAAQGGFLKTEKLKLLLVAISASFLLFLSRIILCIA